MPRLFPATASELAARHIALFTTITFIVSLIMLNVTNLPALGCLTLGIFSGLLICMTSHHELKRL
jgi:hypothetical protein